MATATNRWLDKLAAADKAKGGTGTDYKLAQLLGVDPQLMSKYRRGLSQMGDDGAIAAAEFLGVRPMIVLADIHSERARTEREKRFWRAMVAAKAAVILSAVSGAALTIASELPATLC